MRSASVNHAHRAAGDKSGATRRSDERRASSRVLVEGRVQVWRPARMELQSARMRDISLGGAFLETQPLSLGEEIRVEIEGDYSAFTMDAVVTRSSWDPYGKGSVGIRFLDRDARSYTKWLE